jgi:hypothetical protein
MSIHFSQRASNSRIRVLRISGLAVGLALIGLAITGWASNEGELRPTLGKGLTQFVGWLSDNDFSGRGISITNNGTDRTTATWSDGHDKLKVRIEGEVEFGDEDHTISHLSKGGRFAIWEKRGDQKTELDVQADRSGNLTYDYQVNGKETAFDDAGRAWLATVLVDVVRKTGIGAEERVNRILDRDGVAGLIKEVQLVPSEYVKRLFLTAALERPELSTADCSSILEEAAMSLESDYEKTELLLAVAKHRSWNASLIADYVDVAVTIESDYEVRRALTGIKLDRNTSPDVLDAILRVASRMKSDYEIAELLVSIAPDCRGSEQLTNLYIQAASGIKSDYEARRALSEIDWASGVSTDALVNALQLAGRLSSDYDAAELLTTLAPPSRSDDRAVVAFMSAVGNVESDYDAGRTLTSFCDTDHLDAPAVLAVLDAAGRISSGYDRSNVLRAVSRHCHDNDELADAYLKAVDAIDSDYDRQTLQSEFYRSEHEARRSRRSN